MPHVFIDEGNSYRSMQYIWSGSYFSQISKSQPKSDTFEPSFLVLEAVLATQNSAKQVPPSNIYLLFL